jgi:hypothetical protein
MLPLFVDHNIGGLSHDSVVATLMDSHKCNATLNMNIVVMLFVGSSEFSKSSEFPEMEMWGTLQLDLM